MLLASMSTNCRGPRVLESAAGWACIQPASLGRPSKAAKHAQTNSTARRPCLGVGMLQLLALPGRSTLACCMHAQAVYTPGIHRMIWHVCQAHLPSMYHTDIVL